MSRSRLMAALAIATAAGYPLFLYRDPPTPKIDTTDDDMERIAKAERKRARKAAKRLRDRSEQ